MAEDTPGDILEEKTELVLEFEELSFSSALEGEKELLRSESELDFAQQTLQRKAVRFLFHLLIPFNSYVFILSREVIQKE